MLLFLPVRSPLLLAVVGLLSCTHTFPPSPQREDVADHDRDGQVVDRYKPTDTVALPPADLQLDACGDSQPVTWTATGACSTTAGWGCLGVCAGTHRWGCFQSSKLQREIRCDTSGVCTCRDGSNPLKTCATLVVENGRAGCALCREVFDTGCCR